MVRHHSTDVWDGCVPLQVVYCRSAQTAVVELLDKGRGVALVTMLVILPICRSLPLS